MVTTTKHDIGVANKLEQKLNMLNNFSDELQDIINYIEKNGK